MFRTAAYLAFVLSHVAPHFGPRVEAAVLLSELGRRRHVDPLLIIADAKHESDWDPNAANKSSGTLGLALQLDHDRRLLRDGSSLLQGPRAHGARHLLASDPTRR
jgi:hypothetical protein